MPQTFAHRPLTRKQYDLLTWITSYVATHGYAPSFTEMARGSGLRSLATVHKHMTGLEERGLIRRSRVPGARKSRARSIELNTKQCPYCGHGSSLVSEHDQPLRIEFVEDEAQR